MRFADYNSIEKGESKDSDTAAVAVEAEVEVEVAARSNYCSNMVTPASRSGESMPCSKA